MKQYLQHLVTIVLALIAAGVAYGMMRSDMNRVTRDHEELRPMLMQLRESNARMEQKLSDLNEQMKRNSELLDDLRK